MHVGHRISNAAEGYRLPPTTSKRTEPLPHKVKVSEGAIIVFLPTWSVDIEFVRATPPGVDLPISRDAVR